jgi:hypothetical protein
MADEEDMIKELNELRYEVIQSRKFGVYYSDKINEENSLENKLIELRSTKLNNEFISIHKWVKTHTQTARTWDIVNYNGTACKVLELGTTSFNEAGDTFNYAARLIGIFIGEEFRIDFSYYDTIDILIPDL